MSKQHKLQIHGDGEDGISLIIFDGLEETFNETIFDINKIFKVNGDLAIHVSFMNGFGWIIGTSVMDSEAILPYMFEMTQCISTPNSMNLMVLSDNLIKVDGIYGDEKSVLKGILKKYELFVDDSRLGELTKELKENLS